MYNLCVEENKEKKFSEIMNEREIIAYLLNQLGIPRNTAGYNYLLYIILKINKSHDINVKLTTELYPQIADELDSTVRRIERGLRYSIEAAWDRNR
jgi:two-component system response regulator (stage 0 sporulation protein A)